MGAVGNRDGLWKRKKAKVVEGVNCLHNGIDEQGRQPSKEKE